MDFIHDFTTAMCLDRFHLGGNSMGCDNSVMYALAHPERVVSLALIATRNMGLDLVDEEELAALVKSMNFARASTSFDGTEQSMRSMMEEIIYRAEAISDDLIRMRTQIANNQQEAQNRRRAHVADANERARLTMRGRLDKLTIPTIYLYGRDDVLSPVEGGYLQEDLLPNFQCFYPSECGHQGQSDQPEMFNQVFLEFFSDGKVSRKTAEWAGVSKRRPELTDRVAHS